VIARQNSPARAWHAEKKWRPHEQQECRQHNRAKEIDVLRRIESHAAKTIRGIIPKAMSNKGMRGLVQRYGEG
jgi:hypothetical protein